ncbi:unnamed protein product [Adineta ricciae]|uniref:Uncharacterized protein n=1 Tax=Adineta ricciae TaxID=249248 RepID=A0A815LHA8_ADIRI|nr:unnamed protein product [Adineta ricciae]CAF1410110.1 unnamed protein product [Adineta ricciae]
MSTETSCQYPIQITNIQISTYLGPNERAVITVNFANISRRSYGMYTDLVDAFVLENHRNDIRVVPVFVSNIHTNVLLMTNSRVERVELLAY